MIFSEFELRDYEANALSVRPRRPMDSAEKKFRITKHTKHTTLDSAIGLKSNGLELYFIDLGKASWRLAGGEG